MKQKKIVSMIGMLVVLISAVFMITGCSDKPVEEAEYTKEDFALKFKNESGKKCYIQISGCSRNLTPFTPGWISSLSFPTVLKTEMPIGGERTITVKDVVVSGKTSKEIRIYTPEFCIHVIPEGSTYYYGNGQTFISESKSQYTEGTFRIKLEGETFKVDYTN